MKMVLSGMLVMMASYTAIGQHTPKRATRNESFEKFDIEDFEVKRAQSVEGGKNLNHFQLADSTEIFRAGYTIRNFTFLALLRSGDFPLVT